MTSERDPIIQATVEAMRRGAGCTSTFPHGKPGYHEECIERTKDGPRLPWIDITKQAPPSDHSMFLTWSEYSQRGHVDYCFSDFFTHEIMCSTAIGWGTAQRLRRDRHALASPTGLPAEPGDSMSPRRHPEPADPHHRCSKAAFRTEASAIAERARIPAQGGSRVTLRAYLCPHCRFWHLTRRER